MKENKRFVKINYNEILYVEGFSEYIKIYTSDKRVITKLALSWLEEQLPESDFIRIHKSFIISFKQIEAFSANYIEIGSKEIPIGRSYKNSVSQVLKFPDFAKDD